MDNTSKPQPKKAWFADMLAKPRNPCDGCTVGTWGACYHLEYGKCKHAEPEPKIVSFKSLVSGLLILLSGALAAQPQQIGYLVTIDKGAREIEVYKLDSIAIVEGLVNMNFRLIEFGFAAYMLKDSSHFQIITNNIEFYCQKKRIVGRKKDGTLKFRNLKKSKS